MSSLLPFCPMHCGCQGIILSRQRHTLAISYNDTCLEFQAIEYTPRLYPTNNTLHLQYEKNPTFARTRSPLTVSRNHAKQLVIEPSLRSSSCKHNLVLPPASPGGWNALTSTRRASTHRLDSSCNRSLKAGKTIATHTENERQNRGKMFNVQLPIGYHRIHVWYVHLPTFTIKKTIQCKYTIHGSYGQLCAFHCICYLPGGAVLGIQPKNCIC